MGIKDRLDEAPAEGWKPQPGDELIGIVTSIGSRSADYGAYPIVTVKPEDGDPKAFHAYHTVARDQLEEAGVRLGDEIGVRYLGRTEGGNYGSYENYRIVAESTSDSRGEPMGGAMIPAPDPGPEPGDPGPDLSHGPTQAALDEEAQRRQAEEDDIPF